MSIKRRTRISPTFSMSSMTDIIFLLLIFFMITSTGCHKCHDDSPDEVDPPNVIYEEILKVESYQPQLYYHAYDG